MCVFITHTGSSCPMTRERFSRPQKTDENLHSAGEGLECARESLPPYLFCPQILRAHTLSGRGTLELWESVLRLRTLDTLSSLEQSEWFLGLFLHNYKYLRILSSQVTHQGYYLSFSWLLGGKCKHLSVPPSSGTYNTLWDSRGKKPAPRQPGNQVCC